VKGSGLDRVQAWLGCNIRAQKSRAQNKAEAGGGRHCTQHPPDYSKVLSIKLPSLVLVSPLSLDYYIPAGRSDIHRSGWSITKLEEPLKTASPRLQSLVAGRPHVKVFTRGRSQAHQLQ
jgi:hypothetical protein